jgi:maltose-binding protein MalE
LPRFADKLFRIVMLIGIITAASNCASQSSQQSSPSPSEQSSPSPSFDKGSTGTVIIRVSGGASGGMEIPFSGSYGTLSGGWTIVEGTTPAKYQLGVDSGYAQPDNVAATIQKQAEDNTTLTVQIVSEGEIKQEQSTKEPFGMVSVNYNPSEGKTR